MRFYKRPLGTNGDDTSTKTNNNIHNANTKQIRIPNRINKHDVEVFRTMRVL
jgi:hypothetical protein